MEILIKFLKKFSLKFVEISGNLSGMNVTKILGIFLGNFRQMLNEIYRKLEINVE